MEKKEKNNYRDISYNQCCNAYWRYEQTGKYARPGRENERWVNVLARKLT